MSKTPPMYGIPATVRVGKYDYEVVFVKAIEAEASDDLDGDKELTGLCCTDKKQILLKIRDPEKMRFSFIHEFLHAIITECKADVLMSSDLEEIIVENIAEYFEPFMKKR